MSLNLTITASSNPPGPITTLSITITILIALYILLNIMYSFYLHCLRSPTNLLRRYSPSFQSEQSEQSAVWAVVTGPTKGIGLSMANKLAARGFSILLVGRSLPRLKHVKEKIDNNIYKNAQYRFGNLSDRYCATHKHSCNLTAAHSLLTKSL